MSPIIEPALPSLGQRFKLAGILEISQVLTATGSVQVQKLITPEAKPTPACFSRSQTTGEMAVQAPRNRLRMINIFFIFKTPFKFFSGDTRNK